MSRAPSLSYRRGSGSRGGGSPRGLPIREALMARSKPTGQDESMKRQLLSALLVPAALWACAPGGEEGEPGGTSGSSPAAELPPTQDPLIQQARSIFAPIPYVAPEIEGNSSTPGKVELGKMLCFGEVPVSAIRVPGLPTENGSLTLPTTRVSTHYAYRNKAVWERREPSVSVRLHPFTMPLRGRRTVRK